MAQPGNFTPILLYGSSTPGNVPLAANLTNSATGSEIAINVADKNLFFKDSGGTVNTVPIRQSGTSSNGWLSSTDWNTFNNKQPAGTYVTTISIASSNGFTGTSSGGATPSLTLATSVTGLLKGNGTAISAATSGTDYAPATSGTSILYGNGAGGFSNVTIGTGVSFAGGTLSATGTGGTVTSVAALTLGTTGTDLSSTVANGTTTPVITLNVPTASAANRGALSAADWSTFNGKQAALVSGTNIKTVGGVTLLGSGDVGTIGIGYGGTNTTATPTAGGAVYGTGSAYAITAAGTTNQLLQSAGSGAPTWTSAINDVSIGQTTRAAGNFTAVLANTATNTFSGALVSAGDFEQRAKRYGYRGANAVSAGTTGTYTITMSGFPGQGSGGVNETYTNYWVTVFSSGSGHFVQGVALYTNNYNGNAILLATIGTSGLGGGVTFGTSGTSPTATVTNASGSTPEYSWFTIGM